MAKTLKKITYLDPMSEEFSAAMTGAFREGVDEVVHTRADYPAVQRRPTHRVRHAKKKKKARR